MICDKCGKTFRAGNNIVNGLPNGVTMVMKDGKDVTMCNRCLIQLGRLNDEGKAAFFKSMGLEVKE